MGKNRDQFKGIKCTFCNRKAQTRDHIPPSGIFADPKPTDLITVPSCYECNNSTKLDDEYFRLILVSSFGDDDYAKKIVETKIIPKAKTHPALLAELIGTTRDVELTTETGIFYGRAKAFQFKRERIQPIVEKIVKGLFWRESGKRLSHKYAVAPFLFNSPPKNEEWKSAIVSLPLKTIGNSEFSYRFFVLEDDPYTSMWWLVFYNKTLISTVTVAKTEIARKTNS